MCHMFSEFNNKIKTKIKQNYNVKEESFKCLKYLDF